MSYLRLFFVLVVLGHTSWVHAQSNRMTELLGCAHKALLPAPDGDRTRDLRTEDEYDYDVEHYQIDVRLSYSQGSISGTVTMDCHSNVEGLESIIVHLRDNMVVNEITMNDVTLDYNHADHEIEIFFDEPLAENEAFSVAIRYRGNPSSPGEDYGMEFTTSRYGDPVIWTQDEPEGSRYWMPCHDVPDDKATVEYRIRIPDNWLVATNGRLIEIIDEADATSTHVWRTDYRTSTYLMAITASEFITFSDWYHYSETDSMEIKYYIYPEQQAAAEEDFSVTDDIIHALASAFQVEYPFLDEKYGMVVYPWGGAMENQTMTSYGQWLVRGDHRYDWINAHELGHQWWGDLVGPMDWREIWLNEGFASYSEALWAEYLEGEEGLRDWVRDFHETYIYGHSPAHAIYDPPPGHLFCAAQYDKGGSVLHMLRWVVGDEAFFDIFPLYAEQNAYESATTEEFKAACEEVTGQDLDWFFDEWIYNYDYPQYTFAWGAESVGDQYRVELQVGQIQPEETVFEMPLEVEITLITGDVHTAVIDVDEAFETAYVYVDAQPVDAELDPNGWVLCTIQDVLLDVGPDDGEISVPQQVTLYQNVPNPFNPKTQIRFFIPETAHTTLQIYSITGQLVKTVYDEELLGGKTYAYTWHGDDEQGNTVSSGTYFYRLTSGDRSETRTMVLLK
ncbi:MAG: T9SS C-terminal target domain-containing protein [Gemmatimonadetes bacterium]|nr:MAG: T9SS C-terminal target domain-containing protein [Gemmatimonadota bacterium]